MSKKILSVMLALVMVLSVFSISAFAAVSSSYEKIDEEAGETQIAYTQKWSLVTTNEPDADGYYTVDVVLETNYNTGIISFDIVADGAKLVEAVAGSAITYKADVAFFEGMEHIDIIPNPTPAQAAVNAPVFAAGSVIATLTYALDDGASTATLKLMNDSKCEDNQGGTLFAVRLDNGTLASNSVHYGQRVIDADGKDIAIEAEIASVTIGEEVAAADPVLSGVGTGVVDEVNGFVYGVVAGDPIDENYFTVENGTFEMVANASGNTNGTGATLVVKNTAGEEFATYTLVIFGDINGDVAITSSDYGDVKAASLGAVIADPASAFAADTNGDGSITSSDYGDVKAASLGADLTVNPYAA